MKPHVPEIGALIPLLILIQVNAQLPLSSIGGESAISVTNDDKSFIQPKQYHENHETYGGTALDNGFVETYERVVLEGSSIRISCPHLITNTLKTSFSTVQKESYTAGRQQETPASFGQQNKPSTNFESVKWFRNHVPLLNLNHSFQGTELPATDFARPTTINITELHRTAESKPTVTRERPQVEQLRADAAVTVQKNLLQPTFGLTKLSDSFRAQNANELVLDIRQRLNVPKLSHEQLVDSSGFEINTFGELVIKKVSKTFAGKYTCLSAGKQSEVLLDVILDNRLDSNLSGEQAYTLQEEDLGATEIVQVDEVTVTSREIPLVFDHHELEKITSNTSNSYQEPRKDIIHLSELADLELNLTEHKLINPPNMDSLHIYTPEVVESSTPRGFDMRNNSSRNHRQPISKRLTRWRSTRWRARPVHLMRPEILQVDDLKSIPGLLYIKQQMHCPIGSSFNVRNTLIHGLVRELCKSSTMAKVEEIECKQLATQTLYEILIKAESKRERCSSSTSELLWFKNDTQLKFDANGRSSNSDVNIKINDFLNQYSDKKIADRSERNRRVSFLGESNQSSDCLYSIQGRTLELDGLKKDNDGRYSCALKLSIPRLLQLIQGIKNSTRFGNYGRNKKFLSCDGLHTQLEPDFKHKQSPKDFGNEIESEVVMSPTNFTAKELLGLQAQVSTTNAVGHQLTDRIALFRSFLEGESIAREQSLDCIERLLSRLRDPLTTVQTFSLVIAERPANSCDLWTSLMEASNAYTRRKFADFKRLKRNLNVHRISSGNLADVYIFQPRSTASPSSLLPLTLQPSTLWPSTSSQLETVTNSDSRTDSPPEESSSSTQSFLPSRIARSSNWIEPIKRLNANIDDATELNRLRANDDETSIGWQIKQHRPKINGSHLEANAPPAAFVASELDVNLDRALEQKVSNEVHLMHDNNDSRRPYSFVGVNRQGNYLPPFNAYESDSLNPEVNTEQTKSHDPYEKPFNYANELNYGPNYASRIADDQYAKTKTLSESSASSLLLNPVKRLIGETDDYLSFGTKELITQRRSHRINIGKTAHFHSLQTNPDQKLSSRSLVINKQQQDDKMPISLNDEGFSRASQPIVGQSYSSKRNLANGLAKRFISDTRSRSHIWPYYRATRLSKRHRTSEQDDDHLEIDESRSAIAQSSLHQSLIDVHEMDITNQGVKVESERETEKAGSRSSQTTSEPTFSADQLNGERLLPDQKGTNRVVYSTSPPILHQNSYQALDSDDTLDESLMWSASHYLHMHMKALATSSMFGVEVGVEWSSERANQTNVPLDVELKSVPYPDEVRARIQPLSASPFATIDMLSGQDLQLECTAHTLGRLPEVKWYKKISRIPKRLKKANIAARRIGSDLYWPLTELDLLEDKPYGHTSFISSQTITVFDNLENQTFTVINNIQLSQYNDKVELQTIRHNNMPFSHYNLYACFVDADVRHDYATLGVNYRETLSKFALDFENRIRTRKAIPVSETSDWPSKAVPHGDNIYNMLRTSQINFPIGNHWIPIQNKSDFEDFGYETLPYAPAMLTITIVVVSASLLTLVYLTVRSYRGLVELQMEENLFNHKKVVSANSKDSCDLTNNYKIDKYNAKYCTFGLENRVECLCQLESEFIKGETLSFDTSDVEIETDFAFELEPSIPDQQVLEQQFYDSYYQNLDSFTNQQSPGCHYSGNSVIQDFSYGPIDSPIDRNTFSCNFEGSTPKDTSGNRDSINLFVNPLDSDAE